MTAMSLQLNKRFIDDPLFAYHSENISFNAHTQPRREPHAPVSHWKMEKQNGRLELHSQFFNFK